MNKTSCISAAAILAAALLIGVRIHRSGSSASTGGEETSQPATPAGRAPERRAGPRWPRMPGDDPAADAAARAVMELISGRGSAQELPATLLWDPDAPIKDRRRVAWQMATGGNPDDFLLLTSYLSSGEGDEAVMATLLEALGASPLPAARDWLLAALEAEEPSLQAAALRGLARMNRAEDVVRFAGLMLSADHEPAVRAEAARALGMANSPEAGSMLMDAYAQAAGDELTREWILDGLGHRDIAETGGFFRDLMLSSEDAELRRQVIEAVGEAQGDPASFLMQFARDPDAEVRAEVAWTMGMLDEDHPGPLLSWLQSESDGEVRSRIYQALDGQEIGDMDTLITQATNEQDPGPQLAGYSLLAANLGQLENDRQRQDLERSLASYFEQVALSDRSRTEKLQAVLGMQQLDHPDAKSALRRIAAASSDPTVAKAAGGD